MYELEILRNIEASIEQENIPQPEPMPGDRWLLASAMQKAIRRGEVARATRAATSLYYQDKQALWRRLHIVALEDVGVASPDVLAKVLTATASPAWRRKVGELRVILFLTRLLCEAVKSRMADELFIQAQCSAEHVQLRERFANASNELLAEYAADEECSLVERGLALWYLAGMKRFPSDVMPGREGSPEAAVNVLRSLASPTELVEICIGVMNKTPWPLSVFQPLIWQTIQKQGDGLSIKHDNVPVAPDVEGLPVYAADTFTRVGQTCFRHLQKAVPEFKQFTVKQIGISCFYGEGGRVDRLLTSEYLESFKQAGELADIESAGLCLPSYMGLRECLAANAPLLESIRMEQLHRHLNGAVAA